MIEGITGIDPGQLDARLQRDFNDRDSQETGFWTAKSKEISDSIWMPPSFPYYKTVSIDPDVNIMYYEDGPKVTMDKDEPVKDSSLYVTRKMRIFPDSQARAYFEKCFGIHRLYYNTAVEIIQSMDKLPSEYKLRDAVHDRVMRSPIAKAAEDILRDSRDEAVRVALTMATVAETHKYELKQGNGKMGLGFLTKRCGEGLFILRDKAFRPFYRIFTMMLGKHSQLKFRLKDKKWLEKNMPKPTSTSELIKKPNGRYYLHLVYTKTASPSSDTRREFVALDPGYRTFQTFYSEGMIGKIRSDVRKHTAQYQYRIRRLTDIVETNDLPKRTVRRIKDRIKRLRTKVSNIIANYH